MARSGRRRRWLRALVLLLPVAVAVLRQVASRRSSLRMPPGFDAGGGPSGGSEPDDGPGGPRPDDSGGPSPRPDDGSGGGPRDGGVREPRRPKPGPYGVAEHQPEPVERVFLEPGQPDRVVVGADEP